MSEGERTSRYVRKGPVWLRRLIIGAGVLGPCVLIGPGCAKPLFPDTAIRTQFDQYDLQRGQFVEQRQYDAYGKPVPAIRERLRIR